MNCKRNKQTKLSRTQKHRKKHRGSIAITMMLSFSLLMLGLVAVHSFFSLRFTREEVQNNAIDYTEQLIVQVNADIDRYVDYIKDISDIISRNTYVTTYLSADLNEMQETITHDRVSQQLNNAMSIRKEISSIALITWDGRVVLNGGQGAKINPYADYTETDWYQNALLHQDEVYVSSSHVQNIIDGEYRWVVSFSKAIFDFSGNARGVLLVDLNYEIINEICARIELGNRGYLFLIDGSGDVLWHPQQRLLYANLKDEHVQETFALRNGRMTLGEGEEQRLYVANHSLSTGWTAAGVVYLDELLQNPGEMYSFYLITGALSLSLAIILCIVILRAITNPIRSLAQSMVAVEEGRFDVRSEIKTNNELGVLSDSFNHMIEKTQELMQQLVLNEEQKREIEWRALQAQIKPHFLYNTLDSIIWMAHAGNTEAVVEMTVALAALLRTSIGNGKELTPLHKEIEHVRSYLTIQKMRYDEKLSYAIDIDENVMNHIVPKLLLQPLVENAIYHGIKIKESGGSIRVAAMQEDENLIITIEDTGVGMTREQLSRVFDSLPSEQSASGIGVGNVQERIRIHYGPEYGLKFFSEPGKGTTVLVLIPATSEG